MACAYSDEASLELVHLSETDAKYTITVIYMHVYERRQHTKVFALFAGSHPPRYLTVVTSTGMSDQLVAAVSGLALAIMTDRAFILTYHMGDAKV